MRRIAITNITPSVTAGVPATIQVALDFTSIFHGKQWISSAGVVSPWYTYDYDSGTGSIPEPPVGTVPMVATTFDIVDNVKYAGSYTVFTKPTSAGLASSSFSSGSTTIRVNEAMPLIGGDNASLLTSGVITNISTYLLIIDSESSQVMLENSNLATRPIELVGRLSSGWGEVLQQNILKLAQSFSSATAPANPFRGQLWYDTSTSQLKIMPTAGGTWTVANANYFGSPYRHVQSSSSSTWTVNHNLNLPSPFVAQCDFFVYVGGNIKMISPQDVTFTNANSLTVTYSSAQTGVALIRG